MNGYPQDDELTMHNYCTPGPQFNEAFYDYQFIQGETLYPINFGFEIRDEDKIKVCYQETRKLPWNDGTINGSIYLNDRIIQKFSIMESGQLTLTIDKPEKGKVQLGISPRGVGSSIRVIEGELKEKTLTLIWQGGIPLNSKISLNYEFKIERDQND